MADPLRHALAGTARLPGAPTTGTDADGWPADPERKLLHGLAVHALTHAARVLPHRSPPPPPEETTRTLPPMAAAALTRCIPDREVLPYALARVRGLGFTLPAMLAPRIDPVPEAALLGDQARWLLAQMGRLPAVTADPWTDGTRAERLAWLVAQRTADPAAARGAVVATFAREPADLRAAIVATFATGCGPEDEAFLTACLQDRAASVRRAALVVLARTPAMRVRLAAMVKPLLAHGFVIPNPVPADWIGVDGANAHDRLQAVVSLIDPALWPDLTAMCRDRSWGDVFRPALVDAALLHASPVAARLFASVPDPRLLSLLAAPESVVLPLVPLRNDLAAELLLALPAPWSVELGTLVLRNLIVAVQKTAPWPAHPRVLTRARVALPLRLQSSIPDVPAFEALRASVLLRLELERALAEGGTG